VTVVALDLGGTATHGRLGLRYPTVSISSNVLLCSGAIPELDDASIRPTRDPPPGRAGDWADAALLLVQDRDRIAEGMNDLVVHRLFAAGLALETALGLIGGHPGAGKVQEAIGELDLAIRDVRNVVFDHQQPDPLSGGQPG
jgi:signal transduction histidine kinase